MIIYEVEALKDILMPDHRGCGAYEYCEKHGLFHVGAHKGAHLYINPQADTGRQWEEDGHRKSFEDLNMPCCIECFTSIEGARNADSRLRDPSKLVYAWWNELRLVAEIEVTPMPTTFKSIFKHLQSKGYCPTVIQNETSKHIECPFSDQLLHDDIMRELKSKGLIGWNARITPDNTDIIIAIYVYSTPYCYGADLHIITHHNDGSVEDDVKTFGRGLTYLECYQKIYEDLAVRLKEAHDVCVDFSNGDGCPYFETFNEYDRVLYKYTIFSCS